MPEVLGGLSTPRVPSEIKEDKVFNKDGIDNTTYFCLGAKKALEIYKENNCIFAILKDKSPSCGSKEIHNGNFDGKLVKGEGFTTQLLRKNGIIVYSENDIEVILYGYKN